MYNKYFIALNHLKKMLYILYTKARMARNTKPAPAPASTPAPEPVVVPENVVAPKKASTKKAKQPEVAVAPAPVVEQPAQVVADVAQDTTTSVSKLSEIEAKIQQVTGIIATLKSDVKVLSKTISREQKLASKSSKGKSQRKVSATRKPSGFVKPTLISDELAKFLGKNLGTEMARTDVSKEINSYIRDNHLQDKENGRKIHPDAKLSSLLNIKPGDEPLTYFNLQRFMKHHFVKSEPVSTA
jgi:chromatin remodeling complex protein RSC6